ncbi:MAG: C69 family dipeptidase [Candidatus Latescibacterota bacterium]|nr:MAG: C69 family dipeptidase [Candidatus Latescibacterota bacterium]
MRPIFSSLERGGRRPLVALVVAAAFALGHFGNPAAAPGGRSGCFMILVGKGATADGSVLLAHNNDLTGEEPSLIEKNPRQKHAPGDVITFPSGLEMPQIAETFEWLVLRIAEGFAEGDAVAINEFQVAIAGGVALGRDRNEKAKKADPLVKRGLTGGVRYIALQRSRTARECVALVGNLYNRYGVTYPSGFGVADPQEIWYIESGGGHTWAAVRIPDDAYWVQANGYRIGTIDPGDTANTLTSPDLFEFCEKHGLWDPGKGPFSFRSAFGGQYAKTEGEEYYNRRRVWRAMDLLSPSLELDAEAKEYPMSALPEKKVTLEKLFEILRDHYDGTKYDGYGRESESSGERLIASPTCVHTDVIQLRGDMPADVGAVLWAGLSRPMGTVYLPFYFGIDRVPEAYSTTEESAGSAFFVYKKLSELLIADYANRMDTVLSVWNHLEQSSVEFQNVVDETALRIHKKKPDMAGHFLTTYLFGLADQALQAAKRLTLELDTTNSDRGSGSN